MVIPINIWRAAFVLGIMLGVESTSLRFYHGSLTNYTSTHVEQPLTLLPFINKSLMSMFYIFGFSGAPELDDVTVMLSVYLKTKYTNVVLVDWSNEAAGDLDEFARSYILRASLSARIVGGELGKALVKLIKNGICKDKIHLIGLSLGAHVAAYAGEYVNECDLQLGRITGLDPAGPLFQGLLNLVGLGPTSAKFVNVLHSNPYLLGVTNPIGSIDFWANCNDTVQPGCNASEVGCSHGRSYIYFAETILSPTAIPAVKSDNCTTWQLQKNYPKIIYLGDLVDTRARGNYYFSTNSQPPFAKGRAGLVPNS